MGRNISKAAVNPLIEDTEGELKIRMRIQVSNATNMQQLIELKKQLKEVLDKNSCVDEYDIRLFFK